MDDDVAGRGMTIVGPSRADLRRLAQARLDDAAALIAAQQWDGAFYLVGYAVELGLKSCIIAMLLRTDA